MRNDSTSHGDKRHVSIPNTRKPSIAPCGNLIAYWRERRQGQPGLHLRQKDLAELTDINDKTLSRIENGQRQPTVEQLLNIAAVLDVPPHVLYAAQWRKARETAAARRRELGFGKAYPDLPEPQQLD